MGQEGEFDTFDPRRAVVNYAARFTLHEFLLEILWAVEFGYRSNPQGDFAAFRSEMLDAMRMKMTLSDEFKDDDPPELSLEIQEELVRLAEHFFDTTQARISAILAEMNEQ